MRVADLLTNWRFINKLTLRDAAIEMGLSPSSLARIERGKIPDGDTLIRLMNWLFGSDTQTNGRISNDSEMENNNEAGDLSPR